ncbi:MAG: hypothetical protein G01um1014106_307 [Parcubacteria group bacterium Gr01-1014_106]|nr:MAG: hypothetical protein G01um1014106_307 [Parcubacteria group bacterium Gr01-1014_106]
MWPDNETTIDFLNFTSVADTVAEIIVQAEGRPISIGVSGAWGVGKSSMIKLIRASLEQRDGKDAAKAKYVYVEFNAWLYQGYDDVRAALLEIIASALKAEAEKRQFASAGAAVIEDVKRARLRPVPRAWDLLSFAFSIVVADFAVLRSKSPDGWTRELDLVVGVNDPAFWKSQKQLVESMMRFLTTDCWTFEFAKAPFDVPSEKVKRPTEECVTLLSGGIDSLVGTLDLVAQGSKPLAVSQIVLGEAEKQSLFAKEIGAGLRHLQLNHNASSPGENERSQRSRSLIFLTYGTLAATSLRSYEQGGTIPLYVSENGLISINPPLTDARLGGLSTRTTHPVFMALVQQLLENAGLRVELRTPYRFRTKGEMLSECRDQEYLRKRAHEAISCGRYRRYGFRHCGRCVPCLIRRAAFVRWKQKDKTDYVYSELRRDDPDHARYNDVRSAALALATIEDEGLDSVLGASLASDLIEDKAAYREVVERGMKELKKFLNRAGVL